MCNLSNFGDISLFLLECTCRFYENINFHPLEVVSRYSEPQLQVGENIRIEIFILFS